MKPKYLFCHSLRRQAPTQGRFDDVLPCTLAEAVAVLSLFLENKALAIPEYGSIPRPITDTPFFIARLTARQVAASMLPSARTPLSANRFRRQLQLALFHWPLIFPGTPLQTAVPETVFELFSHTPSTDELIVARLHLWGSPGKATYLRIFVGWQGVKSEARCEELLALLQRYKERIERLAGLNSPALVVETALTAVPLAASSLSPLNADLSDTDDLAPRIYFKSLYGICKLAVARQQWIEQGKIILALDLAREMHGGPSKNTLLKVSDLVLHWHDRQYRWDVVHWLHHGSGHTAVEIADLVQNLRGHFAPEEWGLIAPTAVWY